MSSRFFQGSDSSSDSSSDEEELYSGSGSDDEKKPKRDEPDQDSSDDDDEDGDEDDDDSDDSSSEDEAAGVSRFLKSDTEEESSEEEEDKVTVVKSAKDKRFEELEGTVRLIENAEKIGDWAVIATGTCQVINPGIKLACSLSTQSTINSIVNSPPYSRTMMENLQSSMSRPLRIWKTS